MVTTSFIASITVRSLRKKAPQDLTMLLQSGKGFFEQLRVLHGTSQWFA